MRESRLLQWLRRAIPGDADAALVLATFAWIAAPYLRGVFASPIPGGWDGIAHYGVASVYARSIFPRVSGWMPEFFAGMPFPDFYPPAFYWIVAATSKLGVPLATAFVAVQVIALAAAPLLVSRIALRLSGSRVGGLVAGVVACLLSACHDTLSMSGLTLEGTFDAGLATQPLAYALCLAFYLVALEVTAPGGRAVGAAVLLAGVPLSNVHMVWPAALLFAGALLGRLADTPRGPARQRVVVTFLLFGFGAFLLSAFWTIPMLTRLAYAPTVALPPPSRTALVLALLRPGPYVLVALVAAAALRHARALGFLLVLVALTLFVVVPWPAIPGGRDLAIQPARNLTTVVQLSAVATGLVAGFARHLPASRVAPLLTGVALVAASLARTPRATTFGGGVPPALASNYEDVLTSLAGRTDGRVLVEMGTLGTADRFGLQALVGGAGAHALTTVFRESAVNVGGAVAVRNMLSAAPEEFGVDSKVKGDALRKLSSADQRALLCAYGARYLVLQSSPSKAIAEEDLGARPLTDGGPWRAYELPDACPEATTLERPPVLTFARWNVKSRPDDELDFLRLGEEALEAADLRVTFARSRDDRIDGEDLEGFAGLAILRYRYDDLERAFARVEAFSRSHPVAFLGSDDPLAARLAALAKERSTLRALGASAPLAGATPESLAGELRAYFAEHLAAVPAPVVENVISSATGVDVTLSALPSAPVPLLVRHGFMPNWDAGADGPVYLASPTFSLVFARGRSATLRFAPTPIARAAGALSLLTFVLALVFALRPTARRGPAMGFPDCAAPLSRLPASPPEPGSS